ncbi:MAG: hypothetical protein OCD02_05715 [Spirochaetaceae bacterium]
MRRFLEYGALSAALFTLCYIGITFFTSVTINLTSIALCICGGLVAGIVVSALFYFFSPGDFIPEGEEDKYINKP